MEYIWTIWLTSTLFWSTLFTSLPHDGHLNKCTLFDYQSILRLELLIFCFLYFSLSQTIGRGFKQPLQPNKIACDKIWLEYYTHPSWKPVRDEFRFFLFFRPNSMLIVGLKVALGLHSQKPNSYAMFSCQSCSYGRGHSSKGKTNNRHKRSKFPSHHSRSGSQPILTYPRVSVIVGCLIWWTDFGFDWILTEKKVELHKTEVVVRAPCVMLLDLAKGTCECVCVCDSTG